MFDARVLSIVNKLVKGEGYLLALHLMNLRELPLITSLSGCSGAVPLWKGWLQALVCPWGPVGPTEVEAPEED